MLFGLFFGDWTILIVLPAFIFTLWAQFKVKSTFAAYEKKLSRAGMTAAEVATQLLQSKGIYDVQVRRVRGHLSDHYDPRNRTLNLSDSVYDSAGVAAIGVACHEAGHAIQHAEKYAPLTMRMDIIPACTIGSQLAMPLFFIGILLAAMPIGSGLMLAGIACFSLSTLFQLITLPVEFDASKRAMAGIRACGFLTEEEQKGARQVLTAAAMTYVAALATSLLSLLRLIVIANNSRRN
jgi:Zn-dependent membrane protease YugP